TPGQARCCFFFQAEDGIRDFHVTGVQTCALPISLQELHSEGAMPTAGELRNETLRELRAARKDMASARFLLALRDQPREVQRDEIGRASCRERARAGVVAAARAEEGIDSARQTRA